MTDATSSKNPPGRDNRTSLPPPRSYTIGSAFGPLARNLDKVNVKRLADIERGGDHDRGYGSRR
jgi:hypothetical protein